MKYECMNCKEFINEDDIVKGHYESAVGFQHIECPVCGAEDDLEEAQDCPVCGEPVEQKYKIALSEEALRLKNQGMAVTLIDKVIYGRVAEQRFKRDTAEVMYKTAQENINSIKLQMRILDSQINREWGATQ